MDANVSENLRRPVRGPQFRLRTLMIWVAALAVVFGVMAAAGPIGSAALMLVLTMIGLHVAGNALGTSLREEAPGDSQRTGAEWQSLPKPLPMEVSRLSQRKPLGWLIRGITLLGAAGGFWGGSNLLAEYTGASLMGAAVGAISSGIIGGFLAFLAGSFLAIILEAWWQATRESNAHPPAIGRGLK
jgi:hypothetical protein